MNTGIKYIVIDEVIKVTDMVIREVWLSRSKIKRKYTKNRAFNAYCKTTHNSTASKLLKGSTDSQLIDLVNGYLAYKKHYIRVRVKPKGPLATGLYED